MTTLTVAGLLGLALLVPTTSATAAGETCRGEAATIVGSGPTVTGTEGRDVIVSGQAGIIDALGGNDLVCIVAAGLNSNVMVVGAGGGDDVVDTIGAPANFYVTTTLGAGADTFTGGPAGDTVFGGEREESRADTEVDTVTTGEGSDNVVSGSPLIAGTTPVPNRDVVDTGGGSDFLTLSSPALAPAAVVTGGVGSDTLQLTNGSDDLSIDMAAGTFTSSAGTASFTSYEVLDITTGLGDITYRGTSGNDRVSVRPTSGSPTLDIATGAGQDEIVVEPAVFGAGSRIDGGDGRNRLVAAARSGRMALDLEQNLLLIDGLPIATTGLQDAFLMAPEIVMVGNSRGNSLSFAGCEADLRGGAGRDRLANVYDTYFESYIFDCRARSLMLGGTGGDYLRGGSDGDRLFGGTGRDEIEGRGRNDRVRGGKGHDSLDGGEGRDDLRGGRDRDEARGGGGSDLCRAERERTCER